ncbi:Inositol phosphorylceramide glucuronosyltransferase 1 [Camellia lanceoleosa]|uniref:Inositol phosphorylceramide glucuronosyltransferase 1 n=1 Tax=Camellia lanceoleosa TaxID=1840588 RepID=A0ACC0J553_9ERIC|nr:Inositol phosphorylceramide glucuronosyltransferase 1 [Camellia lanceoleosa]
MRWMVDEKELRVIHYTLGPLKPWDWWTSWLLKPVDVWQNAREHLEETLPGTGGGKNPKDEILVKLLFLLPLFTLLFCYYQSFLQVKSFDFMQIHSFCDHVRQLHYKFRSRGILAYSTVSSSTWTFMIFFLLFGSYLHLIYQWGKIKAYQVGSVSSRLESVDYDSGKGHQRQVSSCDIATCYYGLGMAFLAVATPSLPCFLGITALFLRLGLMFVGGLVLASFMTYASEHLGIRSFLRGLEEKNVPRTRSMCFLC